MHPAWQSLIEKTPEPVEGSAVAFDTAVAEARAAVDGSVVSPLPDQGVIHVGGADAATFLHGQLTNSITDLSPPATRLAAWCSPKGRTLALFRVVPVDDGFLLLLDRSLIAPTLTRLRLFVLRSAVTLEDRSDRMAALGVSGSAAAGLLAEGIGMAPAGADDVVVAGDLLVIRLRSPDFRCLLLGPADEVLNQWRFLRRGLVPVGNAAWRLLGIRDGRAEITELTRETVIPQMLNLEALNGLSYTKGCYPGQEVVARLHYLGRLKRRLYRLRIDSPDEPAPGSELDDGAGTVVGAAFDGSAHEVLAVVRIDAADRDELSWRGHTARQLDLPYDVDAATH